MVSETGDDDPEDAAAIRRMAERLKTAVKAAGGNKIVAEKSGVPLRTVNSYIAAAADPKLTKLDRIALACGTTVDQLLGRTRASAPVEVLTNIYGLKPDDMIGRRVRGSDPNNSPVPPGFVTVPFLDVRASAGPGIASLPAETVAKSHFLFSEAWLRSLGVTPLLAELLQATGDSMYPTIHDGDLMLVDRGFGDVVHGKIYALVVHGLVVVKRVHFLAAGGMVLLSDNERYPSETIRRDEVADLSFQGRIAWYGRAI